jgi:hypothetical protein
VDGHWGEGEVLDECAGRPEELRRRRGVVRLLPWADRPADLITTVWPAATAQTCIAHMIRASMRPQEAHYAGHRGAAADLSGPRPSSPLPRTSTPWKGPRRPTLSSDPRFGGQPGTSSPPPLAYPLEIRRVLYTTHNTDVTLQRQESCAQRIRHQLDDRINNQRPTTPHS